MKVLMLGGAALILLVVVGLPVSWLLIGGFRSPTGPTLEFYRLAFTSPEYTRVLLNTLEIGVAVAVMSIVIGVPMAWLVGRTDMPGRRAVWTLVNVAYTTPPFLTAIAYVMLLGPNAGLINRGLRAVFGLAEPPFNIFTLGGMVFVITLYVFPFVFLMVAGALESLDPGLEQSAQILGAGRLRTFSFVTLPMVAPAILAGALLAFVDSLSLFGPQAILGVPAQIQTVQTKIYGLFSYPPRYGQASALAMTLAVITIFSLYLQQRFLGRRSYITMTGKGAPLDRVPLGVWRVPALCLCGLVFLFSVGLPYLTLLGVSLSRQWATVLESGSLTLRNYSYALFEFSLTQQAILNSLGLAAAPPP